MFADCVHQHQRLCRGSGCCHSQLVFTQLQEPTSTKCQCKFRRFRLFALYFVLVNKFLVSCETRKLSPHTNIDLEKLNSCGFRTYEFCFDMKHIAVSGR